LFKKDGDGLLGNAHIFTRRPRSPCFAQHRPYLLMEKSLIGLARPRLAPYPDSTAAVSQ
jgi:hypothetical protein